MTWQLALALFFVCTTVGNIVRRIYAIKSTHNEAMVSFVQHAGVMLPLGLIWAATQSTSIVIIRLEFWFYVVLSSCMGAVFSVLSLKSQKTVDAGQFSIISNLSTPLVIIFSVVILQEDFTLIQLAGMVCILAGICLVIGRSAQWNMATKKHIAYAIIASLATSVAIIVDSFAIATASIAAYVVIGWALQTLLFACITRKHIVTAKTLSRQQVYQLIVMALARFGSFILFLTAVQLSENVSVVTAIASFRTVIICAAAFVFLKEYSRAWQKLAGSCIATVGLLLV